MTKKLEDMSGAELLAEYNRISPTKRKAKFDRKEEAIKRILALAPKPATKPEKPKGKSGEKPEKAKEEPRVTEASHKPVRGGDSIIRVMVDANPRREGSEAHRHFECMKGSITVAQYLDKFPEDARRTARQWLSNTVKDGFVELIVQ